MGTSAEIRMLYRLAHQRWSMGLFEAFFQDPNVTYLFNGRQSWHECLSLWTDEGGHMDSSRPAEANRNLGQNVAPPQLRAGALNFASVLLQAVTHIAPAIGIVLSLQFITSAAGLTSPLAYAIAFAIVLTLGLSLTQLARVFPSAGGYYTYVGRSIHPSAGFLTAWLYFLYDPLGAAANLAIMSFFLERTLGSAGHVYLPWWISFLILTAIITFVMHRGITVSAKAMATLTISEIVIVVALAAWSLLHAGNGGLNLSSFSPGSSPSPHGLYLGVVFCIFAFSGFESVAPLAEETQDPRRNLPRVIIWSIVLMGAFYLFCSWALLIGWGTNSIQGFVQSTESPVFILARRLWGGAGILVLIAVFNSIIACSIACSNASTRVFFSMGRSGALPRVLGKVHPRYRTPVNAVWFQTILTIGIGLGLGLWIGPDQLFYFMGVTMTLGMVLVYSAGNLGVFRLYRSERRSEFNWWLHGVFPFISTAALISAAYESVVPLPPAPLKYAPCLVALWLVCGVVLVWILSRTGHQRWLLDGHLAYDPTIKKEI